MRLPALPAFSLFSALLPGVVAVVLLALASRIVAHAMPIAISDITVGVLFGLLAATLLTVPAWLMPGIRFSAVRLLRVGIVLLGARLSFGQVLSTGISGLVVIVAVAVLAMAVVLLVSRRLGISPRLAALIGIGTAICGNSAIAATAPVIEADENEVSFAVATITLFGMAALLLYPLIGSLLHMDTATFGYWAGAAVNDTSQATATGFAFSSPSGEIATVVKLTRNTLMGPLILLIGAVYLRSGMVKARTDVEAASRLDILRLVPMFVVGFVLLAVLNSIGLIPTAIKQPIDDLSKLFILMALVAIGLMTDLGRMRRVGLKPLYAGLLAAAVVSAGALGMIVMFVKP